VPRLGATPNEARGRVPAVLSSYLETHDTVLVSGLVDESLKELCARFLAGEPVEPQDERERASLDWSYSIAWESERADPGLWERLHRHFSEPELVELGYAIAFMLGQQHWLRTVGLSPEIPQAETTS
jgi:alkylhydroperoxidase family enzyme